MSDLKDAVKKGGTVLTGAAALASAVKVDVNDEHGEIDRVAIVGLPIFQRDAEGRPRVFGLRFPRWIRGPRQR